MRKLLSLLLFVSFCIPTWSQSLPYNETFESYNVNSLIAQSNPGWWNTWSNSPGSTEDGAIVTTYAHSPSKSLKITKSGANATDLILKLGNKTSGVFELSWYVYIETGFCGYYNLQHFQSPGTEMACEVYFKADGTGELFAGSITPKTFTYPKNSWFLVHHFIDLNNDMMQLTINGKVIKAWPVSYQPNQVTGTRKLGCVEYFATSKSGSTESPGYYVDDISYIQTGASTDPVISLAPDSLRSSIPPGNLKKENVIVKNTGNALLNGSINIIYDLPSLANLGPQRETEPQFNSSAVPITGNLYPEGIDGPTAINGSVLLHYDSAFRSAIGWNPWPVTVTVAARYPNARTLQYAGMIMDSVYVYINTLNSSGNNDMYLKIYGMGDETQPGTLLLQQKFTAIKNSWNKIKLSRDIIISGEDLWVGYQFTQSESGAFIPGCDAGPNDPNGDFLSTGAGWSHLSVNPTMRFNWNIRAHLTGSPMPQWLSAEPLAVTVPAGGNQKIGITLNSTFLNQGNYFGRLRILSNDPAKPQTDLPVILYVVTGVDDHTPVRLALYPNPATDRIKITSNLRVDSFTIYDASGSLRMISSNSDEVNIGQLTPGLYFVSVMTEKGRFFMRFIKAQE